MSNLPEDLHLRPAILRILLIEDDPDDVRLIGQQLHYDGAAAFALPTFEVTHVDRLAQARALLTSQRFDIVLCDLSLPDSQGLDTVLQVMWACPDVPIIVISGHSEEEIAARAVEAGAQDYLVKGSIVRATLTRSIRYSIERHRCQNALRTSESMFHGLFESAPDAIVVFDQEGAIIRVNSLAEALFGYQLDELIGKPIDMLLPEWLGERNGESRSASFLKAHVSTTREGLDLKALRKDGGVFPASITMGPLGTGADVVVVSIVRDITARKRMEETIRSSEQRYRELFEYANDIIYTHDLDGNFSSLNDAGRQVMGYTIEEILSMSLADVVSPEDREKAGQIIGRHNGDDGAATYQLEMVAKDGKHIPTEVNTRLIYQDGNPVGVQGIARDLTQRRLLEDQLHQAQKMEGIGRLAGGVAHDFNNVLTAIIGYSQLAIGRVDPADPLRRDLEEIRDAGGRAAQLTNQLLAFSRKQVLQSKVFDLNGTVSGISKMLVRVIGEDIEMTTRLESGLGLVKADPGQIEQVIINLAVNARDAMPLGGKITLETANVDLAADYTRSRVIKPGSYVMLAVSDTGCGMDTKTLSHIFEPFFTTKERGKGTGLGLATVYGIVNQSGGYIWVFSELGMGTTFKVYLPAVEGVQDAPVKVERVETSPRGTETIMVVEDEQSVRALAGTVLRALGYSVLEAASGPEAIQIAAAHAGPIPLLLTDVVMPQMSGRELAELMIAVRPDIKVLFASGYTDDAIVHHGVLEAGIAFLQKPFTPSSLARKVREVLDEQARIDD